MAHIIYTALNQSLSDQCYTAFLTGSIPEEGWLLTEGVHLYFLGEAPELPEGKIITTAAGPADFLVSSLEETKALAAYKNYLAGRRLPAGAALAAGEGKVILFSPEAFEPDLGHMDMYRLAFDPLEEVVTPQEAAKLYHVDAKRVQADCERAGISVFQAHEVRRSASTWLILKSAAGRVYHEEKKKTYTINPLLLVFSTLEAAHIWNRDSGVVRSAAAGAGHASARMGEGERRKSGRTWLVTRAAMERLFGQALPMLMKEAMKGVV